jgi:hypothetical protein
VLLVVEALDSAPELPAKSCQAFTVFFNSKIGDYACVKESLRGLSVMLTKHSLPETETKSVANGYYRNPLQLATCINHEP